MIICTYFRSSTILIAEDIAWNKTSKKSCPFGAYVLVGIEVKINLSLEKLLRFQRCPLR